MKLNYFCAVLISVILTSCSYDSITEPEFLDQDFISLPEDVDFTKLSSCELQILRAAASRFSVEQDEYGLFYTPIKSAKQINVSENIFNFFISAIDHSNSIMLNEEIKFRNSLLSRSSEDDANYYRKTDCLAWSLAGAIGGGYEKVSQYLYDNYNNGRVSVLQAPEAMAHYGTVTTYTDFSEFPSSWTTNQIPTNNIVAIKNPDGSYHAVNGLFIQGQSIYVMDYQQGT